MFHFTQSKILLGKRNGIEMKKVERRNGKKVGGKKKLIINFISFSSFSSFQWFKHHYHYHHHHFLRFHLK